MLLVIAIVLAAALAVLLVLWIKSRSRETEFRLRAEQLAAELVQRNTAIQIAEAERERLRAQAATLQAEVAALQATNQHLQEAARQTADSVRQLQAERDGIRDNAANLQSEVASLSATLSDERKSFQDRLDLLTEARKELSNQFEVLANNILEEKSRRFTKQNEENLGQLIAPLKQKFAEFQETVAGLHDEGVTGRTQFKEQFERLERLNNRLADEATNLVQALKGSSKAQGDWGERLLEVILEGSGFTQGLHYLSQTTFSREDEVDKSQARPDVVLNLPGNKQLIVDAKVSLVDYVEYCNSEDETVRQAALSRHLASVRRHIRDLSQQRYQTLPEIQSLDFVVMFVPVEPALQVIDRDGKLWQEAWRSNILLATPSTLLFVVRIVDNLWRQEQQQKSVERIVRRGRALYDKLAVFAEELTKVGTKLDEAREVYQEAYDKLAKERGNVIRQAEMLKNDGIKPLKSIPAKMIDLAMAGEPGDLFEDASAEGSIATLELASSVDTTGNGHRPE